MQVVRGLHNFKYQQIDYAVTIGNYDGLHLGHQQVLNRLIAVGVDKQLPTMVIIFEPDPQEFFDPLAVDLRIINLQEKIRLLRNYGIDCLLVLRFDEYLADISAENFFTTILSKALRARAIIVGDDFCFGARRAGDTSFLQECAVKYGMHVEVVSARMMDGIRISSTLIRSVLQQNNLVMANKLLGRSYGVWGRVVHGAKNGSKLGFPTANVYVFRKTITLSGVYVVQISGLGATPFLGVANIGMRPTFGGKNKLLEVHLLDFAENIYGQKIYVEFLRFLRVEVKFDSLELLREQIAVDVQQVRSAFVCV